MFIAFPEPHRLSTKTITKCAVAMISRVKLYMSSYQQQKGKTILMYGTFIFLIYLVYISFPACSWNLNVETVTAAARI